jgi:hypothetical protein
MTVASQFAASSNGAVMAKMENTGLRTDQKAQGVWERRTEERRLGQNQLFGSFRVNSGITGLGQGDPTDNVLAAIASILDEPTDRSLHNPVEKPQIPKMEQVSVAPQPPRSAAADPPQSRAAAPAQSPATDVDEYVKLGPGPLDAIRFKWTARPAGNDRYFVDETIGENSRTITLGPMSKQDAIRLVDERERDARRRFDALKNEMTGQGAAPNPARNGGGAT